MCYSGCNRGRCPVRPGCGCGNRPRRPDSGVDPGFGSRPSRCRRDNVGGARCPYRTPRAWQDPRYGCPRR